MGRFFAFLFVFLLGGVVGAALGGVFGAAAGGYVAACKVIDQGVASGALTQDEANATLKSISAEIGVRPEDKARIMDALKRANQPPSACATAIEAL